MLFTNFAINIAEAELNNQESAKDLLVVLDYVDLAFTFFYCIELGCNLFVHWWKEFVTDGWSMFDSACVFLGVISNILSATGTGKDTGLSIVRSVRILKIVRIFSRLVALHRLISSINATLGPLFYTFLIYVVTNSIYAVLATQFFSHIDVRQFGSFSKVTPKSYTLDPLPQ
jgi:voltage-gated sodium channel